MLNDAISGERIDGCKLIADSFINGKVDAAN
jgi:hypothetical protein